MSEINLSRRAPLEMTGDEFRALGHGLVDRVADFLDSLPRRPVTRDTTPNKLQQLLGADKFPEQGSDPDQLLSEIGRAHV